MTITSKEDMMRSYHDWLTEILIIFGEGAEFTYVDFANANTDKFYWSQARQDRFVVTVPYNYALEPDRLIRYIITKDLVKYLENLNGK